MKRLVMASLAWLFIFASQAQSFGVVGHLQNDETGSYMLAWNSSDISCIGISIGSPQCTITSHDAEVCSTLAPWGLHQLREISPSGESTYFRLVEAVKSFSDRDPGTYQYRLWDYECNHSSGALRKTAIYAGDVTVQVSNYGIESVTVDYRYDALGRLIEVQDSKNKQRNYHYDKAGNRTLVQGDN